ncbi:TPA: ABC transporter substrate-binding protein [Pasteurella multocida]|uniref:DppA n=6 Tax=Pasteurella multocida TaxID=747 RepID=Q9CP30_PASMU|nr:ABC transporter substrate-binding protein [Pasteurella multocida]AWW59906.1 ABC transporter substrate-binding protein [Pasteurellaceae bacterium 12591]AAK02320.1 DppA [Pasteurella multocida subsp. multocida str. Pm70]AET15963.1 periplasmic dipeptide transport protein [Pasteurella multocida 36950]AHE64454.1 periplasmic dipeptide tranort protein [Pasteurella multocida subsp. multocida str. HB03]AIN48427.1 bacterial extracellular solute-binding s, 5 Middle family protein [Pasteurella multocida
MKKLTKLSLAVLAMTSTAAFAAAPKTFVYCSEASPSYLSPVLGTDGATIDASGQAMFNGLTTFERGTTNVIPALAEKWDVSEDGKTYVFHLRKGVKFHSNKDFKPTRDFNADDVVFSFNRQLDPNHPYHKVSGGSYEYFIGMDMQNIIDKVEKVDDYTVKISLKVPNAPFLANLAMDFASIYSAQYADAMAKAKTPEKLDSAPIGTGPFEFVSYQKDSAVRYKAFENYWQGKAKIDRLVFSITPDASVRYAKLQKGECHAAPYPNPADIAKLKADSNITLLTKPGLNVGYLNFNVQKAPFDNVKVRQALNYAVNKDAIIESVYQGAGQVAKNPIPPTMWSYNDEVKDYAYDPEKAKALLKEAGFENGFETDLWAMPVSRPYNPNARRMAELVQADWEKVGVKAKIVSYEWGEYLKRMRAGDHQTGMMGWTGDNGDPDNFLNTLLSCAAVESGSNYANFCHKEFNDLVTKAAQVTDPAERTALYQQAQLVFKEQAPWITIAHSTTYFPVRKEVKGYVIDPFGLHNFYAVELEK